MIKLEEERESLVIPDEDDAAQYHCLVHDHQV
jgi:hypothetical protein